MPERFDTVVIGLGPGGEVAASRLLAAGRSVAVVERELIGGECGYWACIPSKTLLRGTEVRAEAGRVAGVARPELDWPALRDYRDVMIRHLDDGKQVEGYRKQGATVVKGHARLVGPGRVDVDGRLLAADTVVVATGTTPNVPTMDGVHNAPIWTNREATGLTEIPERAVVLGGGAVAVELGQFLARMGSAVTLVQRGDRLLTREHPALSELAAGTLRADGIDLLLGRRVRRLSPAARGCTVELDDGTRLDADVLVVGTGRTPRTGDLGLSAAGIGTGAGGALVVDENCRAGDGVYAVGDVTGVAMFTHVAKYQGRIAADTILGRPRPATYHGIPRVVFTDPEIAAVGLTAEAARRAGHRVVESRVDLAEALARPWTYQQDDPSGALGLVADADAGVLLGAWGMGPQAGEWIHTAAMAVRTRLPIDTLTDQVAQFPTFTEGYQIALEALPD